jgi:hypothetical protein
MVVNQKIMNQIAEFRKCTLPNDELLKRVDKAFDSIYRTGQIPSRHIPARPDEDLDLLVGELILRFMDMEKAALEVIYQFYSPDRPEGTAAFDYMGEQMGDLASFVEKKTCYTCGRIIKKSWWANLTKDFCSKDCTNKYLESEGFYPIINPNESAKVRREYL